MIVDNLNGNKWAPVLGKIPGTAVNLGGHVFIVPPLNLDQVVALKDDLPKLGQGDDLPTMLASSLPILHQSLVRNYPDITVEDLRALLDLGNMRAVCDAIVSTNGLKVTPPGETSPASQ